MSIPGPEDLDAAPPSAPDARVRKAGLFSRRGLKSPAEALQPEQAPPPPPLKRRPGLLSAFSGFLSFLLVACFAAGFGFVASQSRLREPGPLGSDKVLYIAPGTDVPEIIARLESEGIIDSPLLLNTALLVEGSRGRLKAGEYLFRQNASLREVMDTLVNGRQILHSVTIPEGLTSEQIAQRLRDNDFLSGDIREIPKEGSLLPETYKVSRGMARADLLRKMQDDQRKVLEQVWSRRNQDLPIRSQLELVTLASIVEKETGKADERPRVASVFVNRLNKRMRLQSDPTIVYGLVGGRGTLGRGILRTELEKYTPYNTYAVDGLPPGPIANPGRAALEAVSNPSRTSDLYFVADGTGGHVFADSLDAHNRNVVRWRQIEKDARDRGAPEVDRVQPPAAGTPLGGPAVPRPDQRGDSGPAAFGTLAAFAAPPLGIELPQLQPGNAQITRLSPSMPPLSAMRPDVPDPVAPVETALVAVQRASKPAADATEAKLESKPATSAVSTLSFGPAIDEVVRVRGVNAGNDLDGPVAGDDGADQATYPVSPTRRADQKARASRFGLGNGTDALPPLAEPAPVATGLAALQLGEPRRPRAFDASEGTPLDPLRDKTWDLNSAKTVPNALSYR